MFKKRIVVKKYWLEFDAAKKLMLGHIQANSDPHWRNGFSLQDIPGVGTYIKCTRLVSFPFWLFRERI